MKEKVEPRLKSMEEGMDIRTSDKDARKKQEEIHGVKEKMRKLSGRTR